MDLTVDMKDAIFRERQQSWSQQTDVSFWMHGWEEESWSMSGNISVDG